MGRSNFQIEGKSPPGSSDEDVIEPISDSSENSLSSIDNENPQEDNSPVTMPLWVELIFFLFGTNVLMGYNCIINGLDYFVALFPKEDNVATNIARIYNICASLTYFVTVPIIERFNVKSRYYVSGTLSCCCILFLMIYTNIKNPNYIVVCVFDGLTAVCSGSLFGTTMGYAGLYGGSCSSLAATGLAMAGVVTSIFRVISKTLPSAAEGWFYFGLTELVMIGSLVAFILFQRHDIAKERNQHAKTSNNFCERISRISGVFKVIWAFVLEACLCMAITLTIFPGYSTQIPSKHGLSTDWVTTLVTTSYMIGDFLGRLVTRWLQWPKSKWLWIPHVCRLVFFVLFMIPIEGIWLEDDIFIYVMTLLLALTNGYFLTLCISYTAVDRRLDQDQVELASFCVSLGLNAGIFIGSWLTYAMPQ